MNSNPYFVSTMGALSSEDYETEPGMLHPPSFMGGPFDETAPDGQGVSQPENLGPAVFQQPTPAGPPPPPAPIVVVDNPSAPNSPSAPIAPFVPAPVTPPAPTPDAPAGVDMRLVALGVGAVLALGVYMLVYRKKKAAAR